MTLTVADFFWEISSKGVGECVVLPYHHQRCPICGGVNQVARLILILSEYTERG
jgi:hypothetical protein